MSEPRTLAEISRMLARPLAEMPEAAAGLLGRRDQPVCAQIRFGKSGVQVAPLGTPWDSQAPWIDVATGNDVVPVPVMEALASAWEDQAEHSDGSTSYAGDPSGPNHRDTLAACARMLREAITHGGQG